MNIHEYQAKNILSNFGVFVPRGEVVFSTEQARRVANSIQSDKKLSNFISTQLNVQSSMLQLSNKLNKEGIIDSKTKKYFENIDKGIQKLITANKKK